MNSGSELALSVEDYDSAFTEVSFLLDMFVDTIGVFVGKSTPSLAVAAGRKMAANMPVCMSEKSPAEALRELTRIFQIQRMDIKGDFVDGKARITLQECPIGSVCKNRRMELGSSVCQMFHYYLAGILAELSGLAVRPQTGTVGDTCVFSLAFAGSKP